MTEGSVGQCIRSRRADGKLTPDAYLDAILSFDLGEIGRRVGEVIWIEGEGTPIEGLSPIDVHHYGAIE